MQHTLADIHFAAAHPGVDLGAVRAHMRDADADGLGWVQLVAAAVPLVAGLFKKKKRRPAGPTPEQQAAEQERQQMAAAIVQRDQALQALQMQQMQMAAQLRAKAVAPRVVMQRAAPQAPQRRAAARRASPVVPLAIAGAAAVALVFALRR